MLFLSTAILLLRGILTVICQLLVQSRLLLLGRRLCVAHTSAEEYTRALLAREGLAKVRLLTTSPLPTKTFQTKECFAAYFDPKANAIALPAYFQSSRSYECIAIAAHEVGHALQQRSFERLRAISRIVPRIDVFQLAGVGYALGFFALVGGVNLNNAKMLLFASIALGAALVLEITGVLLEYDASRRAKQVLLRSGALQSGALQSEEIVDVTILLDALSISCFGGVFATITGFSIEQFYVSKERGYEAVSDC